MRTIIVSLLAVLLCNVAIAAEVDKEEKAAQKVAADYFEAVTKAEVAKANSLATVPFSLDGKKTLTKKEEVEAMHKEIADRKGARELPEYKVALTEKGIVLDKEVFPAYRTFRISLKYNGRDVKIDIFVKKGKDPKVIGFAD
ncbi:MAG: hypothetical protein JW818_16935 [Pirellulales bacterium]|nr:hypothetical protein [Pirellulales bacterium]